MDSILITLDHFSPLYLQIYHYFKNAIEQRSLLEGDRLPSIRGLAASLSVSKSTVERAYDQLLSEGYLQGRNRARYQVAATEELGWKAAAPRLVPKELPPTKDLLYNFASGEMDPGGFDFALWKRHLNRGLEHPQRLMGYGCPKGEPELRREISSYLYRSRGVSVEPEQILIGSSTQVLLGLLCSLLEPKGNPIAFEDPGFKNGRQVFSDHGFSVLPIGMGEGGLDLATLGASNAGAVYVSPSHQFPTGTIMPIGLRGQLLNWAADQNRLIIEDDYDSEFRYYGNPIPALKGMDQGERVVYLGSFSKMIPPSIRVSYMLLPSPLLERFDSRQGLYNQTASTIEQLALADYITHGHLDRQIRRLRRIYQEKRSRFIKALEQQFGSLITLHQDHSGLFVVLRLSTGLTAAQIKTAAQKEGCRVALVEDYALVPRGDDRILLYFSSIPTEECEAAVRCLKKAWIG